MFSWIAKIFGGIDRTEAAMDRTAKAAEDIAAAFENARDRVLERLGAPGATAALPAPENGTGRKRAVNAK